MAAVMTTRVTVVAEFVARPGKEDEGRELLKTLLGPTRKEEGCLRYDLHEALDRPGHIFFLEDWASKALLDAHLQSPHLKSVLGKAPGIFEGSPRVALCGQIG
jgi:quinol monooxygenase YgiN